MPVAYAGQNVVAVDCGWATDTDAALDADGAGRLLHPVETREQRADRDRRRSWPAGCSPPTSRPGTCCCCTAAWSSSPTALTWGEGRYLAVSLDTALDRTDAGRARDDRRPVQRRRRCSRPPRAASEPLAALGGRAPASTPSASPPSSARACASRCRSSPTRCSTGSATHGLAARRRSTEPGDLAKELGRESLRYLYRILFLLYAEARPELGILPVDDEDYIAGYSMARLGDLVARRLGGEEARTGFHLYESLDLLFRMVNDGHNARGQREHGGPVRGRGPPVRAAARPTCSTRRGPG